MNLCIAAEVQRHGDVHQAVDVDQRLAHRNLGEGALVRRYLLVNQPIAVVDAQVDQITERGMQLIEQWLGDVRPYVAVLYVEDRNEPRELAARQRWFSI